ncbi:MAG: HlyC/CorC family transporter [Candidatus Eisenbacteria bacterium]|nr:HlyC/CorC family transporter [Candidatus Eisenbacteria bacterium]
MISIVSAAVGFAALLYLSGMFSGSETAYFSLSKLDLGQLPPGGRIRRLMERPERLLIAILVGNTLVNVAAGSLGALVALHLSTALGYPEGLVIALEVGVVTFVILVLGEVAPKMYAMQRNVQFARASSTLLLAVLRIFGPVVGALDRLVSNMGGRPPGEERPFVTAEELRTIVALSEERGTLEGDERDMIDSVMEFGDTVIRELMVPRVDMQCFESSTTVGEATDGVKALGFSRVPVFDGDIDHIVGVLYAKDLLKFDAEHDRDRPISGILRSPYFTPESKNAGELLRELQRRRTHIAIVVDEYGGTAGLVTLEDLIEEIVGEISDEHDQEVSLLTVIDSNTLLADGMVHLDELDEAIGLTFEGEGIETLGGYLMDAFGRIPSEGERIERAGAEFTIESVKEQRITSVRVVRIGEQSTEHEDGRES